MVEYDDHHLHSAELVDIALAHLGGSAWKPHGWKVESLG